MSSNLKRGKFPGTIPAGFEDQVTRESPDKWMRNVEVSFVRFVETMDTDIQHGGEGAGRLERREMAGVCEQEKKGGERRGRCQEDSFQGTVQDGIEDRLQEKDRMSGGEM